MVCALLIVQDSEAKLQREGTPNVEACAKTGLVRKSQGPDGFGEADSEPTPGRYKSIPATRPHPEQPRSAA
jgi:hypothetical protein